MQPALQNHLSLLTDTWAHPIGMLTQVEIDKAKAFLGHGCGIVWTGSDGGKVDTYGPLLGLFKDQHGQVFYVVDDTVIPRAAITKRSGVEIDAASIHRERAGLQDSEMLSQARSKQGTPLFEAVCELVSERFGLSSIQNLPPATVDLLKDVSISQTEAMRELREFAQLLTGETIGILTVSRRDVEVTHMRLNMDSGWVTARKSDGTEFTIPVSQLEDWVIKQTKS